MDSAFTRRKLFCLALLAPLVSGCGGGSGTGTSLGSGNTSNGDRGAVTVDLTFRGVPATRTGTRTRAFGGGIPIGAGSVMVAIVDAKSGLPAAPGQLIPAPMMPSGTTMTTVTITFTNLLVGGVNVQVTAYPDSAGKVTPIATGSAAGTVAANATTAVPVTLALTLVKLLAAPNSIKVDPTPGVAGNRANVMATASDPMGRTLRLPIYWLSRDPGIAQVAFDPSKPSTATVTGLVAGNTIVTLVEPNSGMTATVDVLTQVP